MVVGVTGFIGAALACRLHAAGASVIGVSRSAPSASTPLRHLRLDIARATDPASWRVHLTAVDAVVYCAGALQEGGADSLRAVHESGPSALSRACGDAGVRRIVHLSALGVDRAASDFSRSKRAGDEALRDSNLDWVILRPSLVIGRNAFGSSALLRGLAALPLLPLPPEPAPIQAVHIDDVLDTILFFLRPGAPAQITLDLVGPHVWRLDELVDLFRRWLGWRPAKHVPLPGWLAAMAFAFGDVMNRLGWRSAIAGNARRELSTAAAGDGRQWRELTGIQSRDIEHALATEPASVQERWFSRLYLLRPWIFAVCALFWTATGIVALGPGWRGGIALMNEGGVTGWSAAAVVVAGALCDIGVGLAIGWRRTARAGLIAAIVVTTAYAIVGTVLVQRLWSDPMGPMLKVLPILILHLAALALVDDR